MKKKKIQKNPLTFTHFEIIFEIQKKSIKGIKHSISFNYFILLGFFVKFCQNFQNTHFLFVIIKKGYFNKI